MRGFSALTFRHERLTRDIVTFSSNLMSAGGSSKQASEAAAAAAAIAAKIAAQFASGGGSTNDAAYTHDIDINDARNRYLLCKSSTQQEVSKFSLYTSCSYLYSHRFKKILAPQYQQKGHGTPIDPKPRKKTHRCIFTLWLPQKKFLTGLSEKSKNY